MQDQLKNDLRLSTEREKKMKRNYETVERFENNLLFWKKRNQDEIKTFFEEFNRILREKEQICLENNETSFSQNILHLRSLKHSFENSIHSFNEYNKLLNYVTLSNKRENLTEFLNNIKLVTQAKNKVDNMGDLTLDEPNYENSLFDKENEIKGIIMKLKESYGNILNPVALGKEKPCINSHANENVNNTVCYFTTNTSEEKRHDFIIIIFKILFLKECE